MKATGVRITDMAIVAYHHSHHILHTASRCDLCHVLVLHGGGKHAALVVVRVAESGSGG